MGLSFQYPANRIKFEAGFDPAFINKTDGLKHGEEYIIWEYDFPWRFYGWIEPPYYSALAQAESIYVLALAFDLTNDEKYLLVANMAMKAFFVDYDAGGMVTVETHDGSSIFLQILAKPEFEDICPKRSYPIFDLFVALLGNN